MKGLTTKFPHTITKLKYNNGTAVFMKYILLSLFLFSSVITLPAKANDIQSVCNYIAADDKNRIRKALKISKMKLRVLFKTARCNGKNLLEFAEERKALESGEYMISKLTKGQVSENIANLTVLKGFAEERIK